MTHEIARPTSLADLDDYVPLSINGGSRPSSDYGAAESVFGEPVRDSITEGDLRSHIEGGGQIRRAVVVAFRGISGTEYVPYLRLAGHSRYLALALYRYRGPRTYRNLSLLLDALIGEYRYAGAVLVIRDTDPSVARLSLERVWVPPTT